MEEMKMFFPYAINMNGAFQMSLYGRLSRSKSQSTELF